MAAKKPMIKFPRKWHEDFARTGTREAMRLIRRDYGCGAQALDKLVEANRNVAQARTHLISIGPHSSKRTMRLWKMVGNAETKLDAAEKRFMRCTVNKKAGW